MKSLLLYVFLSLALLAVAQPEKDQPQPTFRLLSASGSYSQLYYDTTVQNRPMTRPLSIYQTLSPPLPWPVDGKFSAYRLIPPPPDAPPETPPSREIILAVNLSSMDTNPIIVVFPTSKIPGDPLRGIVIEDRPDRHTRGKIKIVNFSKHPTAVAFGDDTHRLEVGETKIQAFEGGRVLVQVITNKGGNWKSAFRGERRLSPKLRGYLFITDYIEDPDYGPTDSPPPALVKMFFEVSPDSVEE